MPLGDVTGSEVNLPKNTSFKRTRFQQIDDDYTFLPPSLSSYGRELLKDSKLPLASPVTGIYNVDFPSHSAPLKNKLSLYFNQTNTSPKIPIHLDSQSHYPDKSIINPKPSMLSSNIESTSRNSYSNDHSTQTNSGYIDDIMNTNGSAHSNSSYRSLVTSATTAAGETSTTSRSLSGELPQVHTLKKMRGCRRFKNLGPPKRGVSSGELNHVDPSTPPPQFAPEGLVPHSDFKHSNISASNTSASSDDMKEKLRQQQLEFEIGKAYLESKKIEENLIKGEKNFVTDSPSFRGNMEDAFRKPRIPRSLETHSQIPHPQNNQNYMNKTHLSNIH